MTKAPKNDPAAAAASDRAAPATSWAQVVAASRPAEPAPPEEPIRPAPGDLIEHPRFGRCTVHRVGGKPEQIHMAPINGRVIRVALDRIELSAAHIDGKRRVFRAKTKQL